MLSYLDVPLHLFCLDTIVGKTLVGCPELSRHDSPPFFFHFVFSFYGSMIVDTSTVEQTSHSLSRGASVGV